MIVDVEISHDGEPVGAIKNGELDRMLPQVAGWLLNPGFEVKIKRVEKE